MRCKACDCKLSDLESSRKSVTTGTYIDLCNHCYSFIKEDVPTIVNVSLVNQEEPIEEDEYCEN
jgi:hypothetical protein